jgi:Flp pilus assembly protein TadD
MRWISGPKAAAEILEQALEIHPDNASLLFNLACYIALVGRTEEARQYLRRAIELDEKLKSEAIADDDLKGIDVI